jgi:hypothetical protein
MEFLVIHTGGIMPKPLKSTSEKMNFEKDFL